MKCLARQHSDQMICHQCGLVWDVNDPEPPVCDSISLSQPRSTKMLDGCTIVIDGVEYTPDEYRKKFKSPNRSAGEISKGAKR